MTQKRYEGSKRLYLYQKIGRSKDIGLVAGHKSQSMHDIVSKAP